VLYGLHGDTYQSKRVFKVSNLPVDEWTVLEISNEAAREAEKNWEEAWGNNARFNSVTSLLLMQPTSEDNFANTIVEAFERKMPFIYVSIESQNISNLRTPKAYVQTLIELTKMVTPPNSFEVTQEGSYPSKDHRPGYYYEIKWSNGAWEKSHSFFRNPMRESAVYRFIFWAPGDQYEELLPVYDKIVSSVEFRVD
jgi:hypothetical protein